MTEIKSIVETHKAEIAAIVGTAEKLTIRTPEQYQNAAELLQRIKGVVKRSEADRTAQVKPLNDQVALINAEFKPVKTAAENAERVIKAGIADYQKRAREAAEAEEALLRDLRAKEEAKLLAQAEKAQARGNENRAAELQDRAAMLPVAQVAPVAPKVDGLSTRKVWKWELVDMAQVKPDYLIVDDKAVDALVKSAGARAAGIVGGIRVWEEDVVVSRAR